MKRLIAAIAVVLMIGGAVFAATGANASGGSAAQRSSVALEGHYSGHVGHNHVRFNYTHGQMKNFRVNHSPGINAPVHNAGWTMPCIPNSPFLSSHGHWTASHQVKGGYQYGCGGFTHFEAHWISDIHQ